MARKVWIEVALNGSWRRDMQPNVPVTVEEMIADGVACVQAGAAILHLHAMDPVTGKQNDDPDIYAAILLGIRAGTDAIVYPTFTNQPASIPDDVLVNARPKDGYAKGDNRGLSPAIGFPALTVPAGLTADGLPVGLEFLGRPFSEKQLFRFGYAYEQATHRRRPPPTTPPLGSGR